MDISFYFNIYSSILLFSAFATITLTISSYVVVSMALDPLPRQLAQENTPVTRYAVIAVKLHHRSPL